MKWIVAAIAAALASLWLSPLGTSAQSADLLIDPPQGAAGSRFQIVGQNGWTPGERVTLTFDFADLPPSATTVTAGAYHQREVEVLRDGTWSFPIVVNRDLFPFPLWRPGYIVVFAQSPSKHAVGTYVYTVEGRRPAGLPPLAELGSGQRSGSGALTAGLITAGAGALLIAAGGLRARKGVHA